MAHPDEELVRRALAREPAAGRELVQRLTPCIRRPVAGALARRGRRDRGEMLDLVQDIFRILLEDDGRVLRSWSSDGGASLEGFVGLVAERKVASILASGRRSGHAEDPQDPADFEAGVDEAPDPEVGAGDREVLGQVLDAVRSEASPKGFAIFRELVVEERSVEEVGARFGLERDAVYAWRSRLKKLARAAAQRILSDGPTSSGSKQSGGAK